MPSIAVLGSQWGDEGKGKIVDLFISRGDIVARFQGGNNAGHTIVAGKEKFILHLLPSGILSEDKVSILGNGMVINLDAFFQEARACMERGIRIKDRVFISSRAHVSLPVFQHIDSALENLIKKNSIGTTKKGIGPSYAFKALRKGVRICDLFLEDNILRGKLESILSISEAILGRSNPDKTDINTLFTYVKDYRERIRPFVIDSSKYLSDALKNNKTVIIEGSQGCLLDLDHGTYPYVTSSVCTSGGICPGLGIPPKMLNSVIGVAKAYTTRVGNGPFPTELEGKDGEFLRSTGGEYGATTGRPRRCGWLDMVLLKYSTRINGFDGFALTKSDVLSGLEKIPVCTGYRYKNSVLSDIDLHEDILDRVKPVYTQLDGWSEDISSTGNYEDLPQKLKDYISFIEENTGTPVLIVSTGPRRDQTIFRESILGYEFNFADV